MEHPVLSFITYNLTGDDTYKCQWIRDMTSENSIDFCELQEHFKTTKNTITKRKSRRLPTKATFVLLHLLLLSTNPHYAFIGNFE